MEENDIKTVVLDAYFDDERYGGHFTSQDICDNLRETIELTPGEVTEYMIKRGHTLQRQDDHLVWVSV